MNEQIPSPAEIAAKNRSKREHAARTEQLLKLCLRAIENYDGEDAVSFELAADLAANVTDVAARMTAWVLVAHDGKLYLGTAEQIAAVSASAGTGETEVAPEVGVTQSAELPAVTEEDASTTTTEFIPTPGEAEDSNETVPAAPPSVTFDVLVGGERETRRLDLVPVRSVLEHVLTTKVEACGAGADKLVDAYGFHGLIEATHVAFADHYGLRLSPDHIWVTIAQGFARLVNQEPELFRNKFVTHEGKKMIRIERNGFVLGNPDNDWPSCFAEFSDAIRGYIGDEKHGLLISNFSTTGAIERAASEVVLMDTVQSYFTYRVDTLCGIPFITLDGSVDDWRKLQSKVAGLRQFGDLAWWLDEVDAIVAQFVRAAGGDVDSDFWNSIYKYKSESGGTKLTGWIVKLLPLVKDYRDDQKYQRNPVLGERLTPYEAARGRRSYYRDGCEIEGRAVGTRILPSSLSTVPFEWNYFGEIKPYQFIAGIVGYSQSEDGSLVVPQMGWAVRPAPKK